MKNLPGTRKSPSLARRRETILAGGSEIGCVVLQWADPIWLQLGNTTCSQSTASINGRATRHNCSIISTNFGDGLQ